MIGKIFGILCLISVIFGIALGNGAELANAVIDGASGAVALTVSLCGMMCFWCGIMRVFERVGVIGALSRMLAPIIRAIFPDAERAGASGEICANVAANLLGIGNAATPFAIKAMEKLQSANAARETASADMITLAVLNTASINLIPTTLIALRRAAGSDIQPEFPS